MKHHFLAMRATLTKETGITSAGKSVEESQVFCVLVGVHCFLSAGFLENEVAVWPSSIYVPGVGHAEDSQKRVNLNS